MNRIDKELHLRGLAKSRTAACELISEGKVTVNGKPCNKPSLLVTHQDVIEICGVSHGYVSRGGLKLEHALHSFNIDLNGKVCLDVGASTGGFTDCMLRSGAKKVYAVDVGTDQLDSKLREDKRVISLEQLDIREFNPPEKIEFTSVDVSFISLKAVLPFVKSEAVLLIKPQFETQRKHKGVIRNQKVHDKVVSELRSFATELGFTVKALTDSPITGKSGNIEFLMWVDVERSQT